MDVVAQEELVADMIYNFVLPEVEKRNMRKKIKEQEQDLMRNAYISTYEKILDLPVVESSQVIDEETCIKTDEMQSLSVHYMVNIIYSHRTMLFHVKKFIQYLLGA